MTEAVVYVAYRTTSIDLRWVPAGVEVHIVVNGGDRPSLTPTRRQVTWIEPGQNLGFGAAVNLGAADASADRLILVNPDCELRAEHWEPLAAGEPHELVTLPLDSHGTATTVASPYPSALALAAGALRLRARLRTRAGTTPLTAPTGGLRRGESAPLATHWVSGACLSVDRSRFAEVGGFSADYFLYYEDTDLSARLAARFPDMVAVVADVEPGTHAVAASADASGGRADVERARSAATYAATRSGPGWWAAHAVARRHARTVARAAALPGPQSADVVIVSLGRESSRGERRRARSWTEIAATTGRTAVEVKLLDDARWPGPLEALRKAAALPGGHLVPETLAWSTRRAATQIAAIAPGTVIVLTSRAYDPRLAPPGARVVLDFVDRLSDSYRDRARAGGRRRGRLAWALLAQGHRRFEQTRPDVDLRVAAGLHDARLLEATYVPIASTVAVAEPAAAPEHDIAFVGNLRYPPNLEAVRELDAVWPELVRRRPSTRLLVAGADPDAELRALAARHRWTVLADFESELEVYASTRLAVAPLPHASGIQTKVIDALRHAVPVVAYRPAAAGFAADAPLTVVDGQAQLITSLLALLDDDHARVTLGRASAAWVGEALAPAHWGWVLDGTAGVRSGGGSSAPGGSAPPAGPTS